MINRIVFLLISFFLFSCEDEDFTKEQLLEKMETIAQSIDELVSISCDNTEECRAAAIGVKPCGGPTHYIMYSSTNEEELQSLITQYNKANKQYNQLTGAISDCSVVNSPTLECVSGNCAVVEN